MDSVIAEDIAVVGLVLEGADGAGAVWTRRMETMSSQKVQSWVRSEFLASSALKRVYILKLWTFAVWYTSVRVNRSIIELIGLLMASQTGFEAREAAIW
jgi:hypothetical protein